MVRELTGQEALHEAIPRLAATLQLNDFERWKRRVTREMAAISARLHRARAFHKDLYLCHFFAPAAGPRLGDEGAVTLIDLHRMRRHRLLGAYYRVKDLAQLLYSTAGVDGVEPRDVARFWARYRRLCGLRRPGLWAWWVRRKAARYARHNRGRGEG
jgi:heptose I phosphotransferase